MKKMKKLASLVLALAMALTLAVPAMAAKTSLHTITIENETTGHTYEAYQVFVGDITGGKLTNIEWGTGVNGASLLVQLNTLEAYADCETPADVAKVLGGIQSNSSELDAFAKIVAMHLTDSKATSSEGASENGKTSYSISVTGDGYYFVKDQDNSVIPEGDAYTKYILKVVENITVAAKDSTVSSDKKVKDTNDSVADSTTDWQDSADYDIGDPVPFRLKATIAEDYGTYTVYKLTFHDTEEKGLTFQPNTVKVYVDDKEITEGYKVVETPNDGHTFDVVFADLKKISSVEAGSVITVKYESILNAGAEIGSVGNKNTMYVTYSNNPNDKQGGENGKTPEDTVIVFTYKVIVNKTDENGADLAGAMFTLEKFVADEEGTEKYNDVKGNWVDKTVAETDPNTTFTFEGLDDGVYRLTETETPAGYNSINPIVFTVTAGHDILADNPSLQSLSGNKVTGEIEIQFNSDTGAGSLTTAVKNQSGATLPETGGMGTTLFYALGAVLVIGAGVALVTKKRMA